MSTLSKQTLRAAADHLVTSHWAGRLVEELASASLLALRKVGFGGVPNGETPMVAYNSDRLALGKEVHVFDPLNERTLMVHVKFVVSLLQAEAGKADCEMAAYLCEPASIPGASPRLRHLLTHLYFSCSGGRPHSQDGTASTIGQHVQTAFASVCEHRRIDESARDFGNKLLQRCAP